VPSPTAPSGRVGVGFGFVVILLVTLAVAAFDSKLGTPDRAWGSLILKERVTTIELAPSAWERSISNKC
jgi:hypothetical protein